MINYIWIGLLIGGILYSGLTGQITLVTDAVLEGSRSAIELVIGLSGVIAFWSGLMRVASEAGLTQVLSRVLSPLGHRLFPSLPPNHPAMGAILLSMAANVLGVGNAATPLGIRAMEEMEKLNDKPGTATDAMCTFLAVTTSSLTLVPATVIALRQAAGSTKPAAVIGTTLLATFCSTVVALAADRCLRVFWRR